MPTVLSVFGVAPSRIGGTETFARELSLQLGNCGWKSVLSFQSECSDAVKDFLNLPNVTLAPFPNSVRSSWTGILQLIKLVRRYRPEILHFHFTGFISVFPWIARLLLVKKIFFTDHSSRPEAYICRRAPFWKRILVRIINYPITKVICVSNYGCACMSSLDVLPANRFELVYNGVDLSRVNNNSRGAEFRSRFGIPHNKKLVAQISWIIPEKGIPDFVEVAYIVNSKTDDVHFVIVGEGPYRQEYMAQSNKRGLGDAITWTGLVRDPFGEGVFEAADVVCQLSRWEELFGWMIAEAMVHRKPVVATRVGGIPELVVQGETGYLVEKDSVAEAADRLLQLLEDVNLRNDMGDNAARIASTKFSLTQNVAKLIRVYGM